jgi:hypothetical protein
LGSSHPGYKVKGMSIKQVESVANEFLRKYHPQHLEEPGELDIEEAMHVSLVLEKKYVVRLVDSRDSRIEAQSFPDDLRIEIPNKCYSSMLIGEGRARFTYGHEIGHALLHTEQIQGNSLSLQRNIAKLKPFESSEWQANMFAGAILVPRKTLIPYCKQLLRNGYDQEQIILSVMRKFCVSYSVAIRRLQYCCGFRK